ncbi:MAG TPA: CPBP family intramembrane glutamic endopeptidase [Candidatus Acidoferrum sp.]
MTTATLRSLNLIEALAFSAYVGWYIWQLQTSTWSSWIVFPVWLSASFLIHRDTPKTMGWRADNLWSATKRSAVIFAPCIAGLCLAGILLGAWHRPVSHLFMPKNFFGYMAFCLLQQVGLNSYLTNRLVGATGSPAPASLLAGTIFAALHWPNPVLIPLTFIGGAAMAWLFARDRNIIPLAIGQGILGTLVWWAFPVAWHHAMRVGPGYYHFHPR